MRHALALEFTPLEFETERKNLVALAMKIIRIYSVGVWNKRGDVLVLSGIKLEFTPLEFETTSLYRQE